MSTRPLFSVSRQMFERHLTCLGPSGFHWIVYSEWPGPTGGPTLVCVHGLPRNGKDFDAIAEVLSASYRVICPDMPGRGRSEYLKLPTVRLSALYAGQRRADRASRRRPR